MNFHFVATVTLLLTTFDIADSFAFTQKPWIPTLQRSVLNSANLLQLSAKKTKKAEKNIPFDNEDKNQAAKRAALDVVLTQIEKSHGRGSVVKLGDADHMKVESISTGSLTLDAAMGGGGYPKGRVVEIFGPESSGKTTLALHAIAESQRNGGQAAFIDAEHALDPAYAASLGVDVDNLLVCQPDSGEMALDVVDQLVRSAAVDIVVVDSVAALVPRAELEGDMSDMQIGLQARLMSKAMRKITGSLAASQCCVIFLNQLRSKVGVIYGSPEVTSGGNALKFYSSVRLDIRRKEILTDNAGIRVKVKVVKNKIAAPFKAVMLDILFGSGIDQIGCMVDAAVDLDIIERRGSWYAYQGENVSQGRQNLITLLKNGGKLFDDLENDVRAALREFGADNTEPSAELADTSEEASVENMASTVETNMDSFL
jgi:recombination protein RecA